MHTIRFNVKAHRTGHHICVNVTGVFHVDPVTPTRARTNGIFEVKPVYLLDSTECDSIHTELDAKIRTLEIPSFVVNYVIPGSDILKYAARAPSNVVGVQLRGTKKAEVKKALKLLTEKLLAIAPPNCVIEVDDLDPAAL